ncbi:MAG: hypothetical protein J5758_07610 [Abditibacteriota bacterium]|nr:hypothetical protein [Abditibacteriota bacterium]
MESKKTVILVAFYLAVLAACIVVTGVGKHNDVKTGMRTDLSTPGSKKIETQDESIPYDPEFGRFDCVLAQNNKETYDLYIDKKKDSRKLSIVCRNKHRVIISHTQDFDGVDNYPESPITDFIIKHDKVRFLELAGGCIWCCEKYLVDNKTELMDEQLIYRINAQSAFNGHVTQAVFITPDIIRISNSVGAVMHYGIRNKKRIYAKDQNGKVIGLPELTKEEIREKERIPALSVKAVWWNGVGEREVPSGGRNIEKISSTEPTYTDNGFDGWIRMDDKTRSMMQDRVEAFSIVMKKPRKILLKNLTGSAAFRDGKREEAA